jgi:hypothetical protein
MKLILPKSGVMIEAELFIEESPNDGRGSKIRCWCEDEQDTQDLFDNVTKEVMYAIKGDQMVTMKKLPNVLSSEYNLEKKTVFFQYDKTNAYTMSEHERKKVIIEVVRNQVK